MDREGVCFHWHDPENDNKMKQMDTISWGAGPAETNTEMERPHGLSYPCPHSTLVRLRYNEKSVILLQLWATAKCILSLPVNKAFARRD